MSPEKKSPEEAQEKTYAKLAYMANQIGKFFAHEKEAAAVADIADHLKRFWDPRMRAQILVHLEEGGRGLDPLVRRAVESLKGDIKLKR
jgi:formate dehydrogenase subunit delta